MFGIGMPELMLIFVLALLVFGPKELPRIARTLGKAMGELRRASDELRDGIQREIELAERAETPPPPPEAVPSTTHAEGSVPAPETHAGPSAADAPAEGSGTLPGSGTGVSPAGPITSAPGEQLSETIAREKVESTVTPAPSETNEAKEVQQKSAEDQPETKNTPPVPVQPVETRNA
jgi:Tat protein translocase TatB subunit